MAQVPYRGNLSASTFPFVSTNFGRSVIVKGADQNYIPPVASKADADKDAGIPQIYYCHNVLPTSEGLQSIGWTRRTPPLFVGEDKFEALDLITPFGFNSRYLLAKTTDGRFFRATRFSPAWVEIPTTFGSFLSPVQNDVVTVAAINGEVYIYIKNWNCYKYNDTTNQFDPVTLTGLDPSQIIGITAVGGYMVAYSVNAIAWSSTVDPTDFVPSLATGAGGGSPEGVKGDIVYVVPSNSGMFIFSTVNCVPAILSGNLRFPFTFREIVNTGGIGSKELVAADTNANNIWCYTTAGVQQVSVQQSQTTFPAVTDFISGSVFEDFDETTNEFTRVKLTSPMRKKLTVVSDRYWILSYGITELTHALVYDLVLQRWGKLKITHVDCFEWNINNVSALEVPKQSIGFLQKDGSIWTVDFDTESETSNGVLILGKFQISRTRHVTLHEIDLENSEASSELELLVLQSLDGKNTSAKVPATLAIQNDLFRRYNCRVTGLNFSLLLKKSFNLVSYVLSMTVDGRR